MARRRAVYTDELWRLAVDGDLAGLRRAAELVEEGHDAHRARAFALAVERRVDAALEELGSGWDGSWPFPPAYALDVARVRFLGGDLAGTLSSLRDTAPDPGPVDPAAMALAAASVRREPALLRPALGLALARGPLRRRLRDAVAILRARFG